jgi:hypothetical protein
LRKAYEGSVKYELRLEGKNSESLSVDIRTQGQSLMQNNGVIKNEIKSDKYIDLDITLSSAECGEKVAYFFIQIEDGQPVSF